MDIPRILKIYKEIYQKNPISGHGWTVIKKFTHYEVHGGFFIATKHKTIKNAEQELSLRKQLISKFPFVPPLSKKERRKQ